MRIEEVIVDPAINHIDRLQAFGRPHVDLAVLRDEIAPFHDLDPHRAREKRVLEVSRVVSPGREQHDRRFGLPVRGDVTQDVEQFLAVIFHRPHAVLREQSGKDALHRLAIFQHVGNAGRTARIVLQHEIIAVPIAHQIRAADVNVNIPRHIEVHELRPEMGRLPDDVFRNDAVAQDALPVIDVVQE